MKKAFRRIALVILCFGMLLHTPLRSYAEEAAQKKVRVAAYRGPNDIAKGETAWNQYNKEYLQMISRYTGVELTYVYCETWNEALAMIRNHEADLIGNMQWSLEREETYAICDASYGYTVAVLAAKEGSGYVYQDYAKIQNAVVGYVAEDVIEDKLREFMSEKNISFTLKSYEARKELAKALETGEIDLVADNAYAIGSDWKIVDKFAFAPFYFASFKGNEELVNTIGQAIIRIHLQNPDFDDELLKRNFPNMLKMPYNNEETQCIRENNTYRIYFEDNQRPLIWYDRETQSIQGVLKTVCEELEKNTGLNLELHLVTDDTNTEDGMNSDMAVTCELLYESMGGASVNPGLTDSIFEQKYQMYHRIGDSYNRAENHRIAYVATEPGMKEYLAKAYPNYTLVESRTPEACMQKVAKKKADLAFMGTHVAENYIITNNLNKLAQVPLTEKNIGLALQFHGEKAQVLAQIVNKGLQSSNKEAISDALLEYSLNTIPNMTVSVLMERYTGLFFLGSILFAAGILTCIILLIYARMMKKERNRLEEINQERMDFFARMSHDMRTPMNGILGMLELSGETENIEEIRSNIKKAAISGEYMLQLINDILDLQRLESKKLTLELQVVYVKELIETMQEMMKPSAEQKQIYFEVINRNLEEDSYINLDPVRVKQILMNIFSNAVKFTPEGGTITILLEKLSKIGNKAKIKFSISDTGLGMSNYYVENNLFKPYSQEYNKATSTYAGSGLGLAIVKNLVELMGGQIEVKSEIGEGTTFYITLEFEYVDEKTAKKKLELREHSQKEIRKNLKGKRILICEDHPLNAEIARRLLEAVGCEATIAEDGEQGVRLFEASEIFYFHGILMDIRMPVMDGLEAAAKIRAMDRADAKTIPIIAMTANAYDTDRENSRLAGMNAHLAKPIDVRELYKTLEEELWEGPGEPYI